MKEIFVPVSLGEILDKITILQIKSEKIKDEQKLKNISKELKALLTVCSENKVNVQDDLVLKLKKINDELWKIEDDIRDKELAKQFDDEFIRLARAVYVTNDKRFEVKKEINLKMGSGFVEEKSYKQYV